MRNITNRLKESDDFYTYSRFIESRRWDDARGNDIVLCDISPPEYKPFYLGANIVDGIVNGSKFNCDRSVWDQGEESMSWLRERRVKDFRVIGICAFMYYQLFGFEEITAQIDPAKETWFEKIDWSGGLLDYKKFVRRQYAEIERRLKA
jgi:hypothetical protein